MASHSVQRSTGFTWLLFLLTALIVPSLMTYHAADISVDIWPHTDVPQNIWGGLGANIADQLFRGLGYGAWFVAISLAMTTMSALMGCPVTAPILRLIGWLIALTGVCTLCSVHSLQLVHSAIDLPMIGPGGFLGVTIHAMLLRYITSTGTILVATSMVFGGTIVCTDLPFVLLRSVIFLLTGHQIQSPIFDSATSKIPAEVDLLATSLTDQAVSTEMTSDAASNAVSSTATDPSKMAILTGPFSESDVTTDVSVEHSSQKTLTQLAEAVQSTGPFSSQNIDGEIPIRSAAKPITEQVQVDTLTDSAIHTNSTSETLISDGNSSVSEMNPTHSARPGILERLLSSLKKTPSNVVAGDAGTGEPAVATETVVHSPVNRILRDFHDETEFISVDQNRYQLPSIELLSRGKPLDFDRLEQENRLRAKLLEKTFADFGFHVRVVEIQVGPVIAMFEIELERGLRLNRIMSLGDDLAVKLRVPSVRIVAPIPGKNTVGIEVPNATREIVRLRELMEQSVMQTSDMELPLFIGKDVAGEPMSIDLAKLPHLLIAGTTGTGKSVCLNAIIISLLMTRSPDEVRMILIDPKMVELSGYQSIPHLMHPPVTDMHKAEAILGWAVEKMEQRYQLLARLHVRNIKSYNSLGEREISRRLGRVSAEEREKYPSHMPYFVLVADEMADLMMTAPKEVESHIIRLAQKSRAVGIHLVLATQKPTVNIITGLIKSNMPARICFKVFSLTDSRVILDQQGGEKLLGQGDMLYMGPTTGTLLRGQGTFLSDDEINRVIEEIAVEEPEYVEELENLQTEETKQNDKPTDRDARYFELVDFVIREGKASTSLLQRAVGLGYGRAARIIDHMFEDGIVGPSSPTKGREVLITALQWERMKASWNGEDDIPDFEDDTDDASFSAASSFSVSPAVESSKMKSDAVALRTIPSTTEVPVIQSTALPMNAAPKSVPTLPSSDNTTSRVPIMESVLSSVPPRRSTRIVLAPPTPDPQFDPLAEQEEKASSSTVSTSSTSSTTLASSTLSTHALEVSPTVPSTSVEVTQPSKLVESPSSVLTPDLPISTSVISAQTDCSVVSGVEMTSSQPAESIETPQDHLANEQEEDSDDDFNWYDNVAKEITSSGNDSNGAKSESSGEVDYTDEQLEDILRPADDMDTSGLDEVEEAKNSEDSSYWKLDEIAPYDVEMEDEDDEDWNDDTEISNVHDDSLSINASDTTNADALIDPFASSESEAPFTDSNDFHSSSNTNSHFRKKKRHKKKRRR